MWEWGGAYEMLVGLVQTGLLRIQWTFMGLDDPKSQEMSETWSQGTKEHTWHHTVKSQNCKATDTRSLWRSEALGFWAVANVCRLRLRLCRMEQRELCVTCWLSPGTDGVC